ncbi:MAG TPA: oligosaccharide flippase family protein, partial [Pyrinomonadaceae bacterium]|nr:oligosaccharide flippase family protein [Pyrinomonadaceae bacterium]
GVLVLINVLIGYLSFADMGMGWASTRFGSDAHARGDDQGEAMAVWTALLIAAGPALLVALTLMFGARPLVQQVLRLPVYLHEPGIIALRLAALGFVARALAGVINTPELVRLRMDLLVLINTGTLVGQILLVPVVLFLGGGLTGAVATIASAGLLAAILHTLVSMRLLPSLRRPRVSQAMVKPLARFGGAMLISALAGMVLTNADKLLLTRYASVRVLAYYSVAFNLSIMLTQAPIAMVQSLLPAFTQLQANPDQTRLRGLYWRALRGTLLWVVPAAVFLCVVARPFLTHWAGPEFGRESTLPLYLLAAGLLFEVMSYVPYTLLMALGRSDIIARCQVAVIVPFLLGSAVSIRWYGATGAAIAWSLRAIVSAVLFAVMARRISGFKFSVLPENVSGYWAAIAILVLPVLAVCWVTTSAVARLGVALVALIVHFGLILKSVLSNEERAWILGLVPNRIWSRPRP